MTDKTPPPSTASTGAFSVTQPLVTLTQRADFLSAARARRMPMPAFLLQARKRRDDEAPDHAGSIRIGYTCSKKVGNAVARNRAKRRLREIARAVIPAQGREGWDYVLIGRKDATATRNFQALLDDLSKALSKVHG
jgi:ribonuclease P protein component